MSRYREPRVKKVRALATVLPGLTLKGLERRPYPPGQHGQSRRKISAYGLRLIEKQKLIFNYGVSEKQLRRTVIAARKMGGVTGDRILELLERRLDNAVFRAGYARTIPAARQLVGHGHVRVNGKRVDRASFLVDTGMELSLAESAKANELIKATIVDPVIERPTWLELDEASASVRVTALPTVDSVPIIIDTQLVVEHYAQSL